MWVECSTICVQKILNLTTFALFAVIPDSSFIHIMIVIDKKLYD